MESNVWVSLWVVLALLFIVFLVGFALYKKKTNSGKKINSEAYAAQFAREFGNLV